MTCMGISACGSCGLVGEQCVVPESTVLIELSISPCKLVAECACHLIVSRGQVVRVTRWCMEGDHVRALH